MKATEALGLLVEVTASQWGMLTTAQAAERGVSRLMLSRLAEAGLVERVSHGVYKMAGAPSAEFESLAAAWMSTRPRLLAEDRLRSLEGEVIVAGASAASLHGIGDLWADRHEFVSAVRRQTQRTSVRFRRMDLSPRDVTLVHGLPAMTVEQTIADLVSEVGDLSLVADALRDAQRIRRLDEERMATLLASVASRHNFQRGDGRQFLEYLLNAVE